VIYQPLGPFLFPLTFGRASYSSERKNAVLKAFLFFGTTTLFFFAHLTKNISQSVGLWGYCCACPLPAILLWFPNNLRFCKTHALTIAEKSVFPETLFRYWEIFGAPLHIASTALSGTAIAQHNKQPM